ncbi:secondary thiamine-phosphate synthase enzyme YjbQ [Patescibacteria group bacterium]
MQEISISSRRPIELIDITNRVLKVVDSGEKTSGLLNIFIPHATAGLILNENEHGLIKDFERELKQLLNDRDFEHNRIDNNAKSHILSGFLGSSINIPFENKKLKLGNWQQIFFVELDGPRSQRKIIINIIQDKL